MPLSREQTIRMALGGTTGLPAPYPTIGTILLDAAAPATGDALVSVTVNSSPAQAVIWSIRAADIAAIEEKATLQKEDADGNPIEPTWHVGEAEVLAVVSATNPTFGIVYLREDTQVLLRLEYGLSAMDSVDVAMRAGRQQDRSTDSEFDVSCKPPCLCP